MARKPKTVFASTETKLFVQANAIMHPLCAMADALPMHFWDDDPNMYLEVGVAIDWCEKEKKFHDLEMYEKLIGVLREAKRKFDAGEIADHA